VVPERSGANDQKTAEHSRYKNQPKSTSQRQQRVLPMRMSRDSGTTFRRARPSSRSPSNRPEESQRQFGGGAIRPLPRDGGVEELHGDPTVGPHSKVWARGQKYCTNVSPPQRGGVVPAPLSERWAEIARQLPRGARLFGRYNRLESLFDKDNFVNSLRWKINYFVEIILS